ncbi:MAG: hypothetical protein QW779_04975 [Nitrososphaerales archaeon]
MEKSLASLAGKPFKSPFEPYAFTPGKATVGAVVKIKKTLLILHPEPSFKNKNLLKKFIREFLDAIKVNLLGVKYPQISQPHWVSKLYAKDEEKLTNKIKEHMENYERELKRLNLLRALQWNTGEELVKAISS